MMKQFSFALLWAGLPCLLQAAGPALQFHRDVRPIISEKCFACHGPDAQQRKAQLRLDTHQGIFERTLKRAPVVVPGELERSLLWQRINSSDPDEVMPPPESRMVLQPDEREKLRKWILAGAPWEGHWAFSKPRRPSVPAVRKEGFPIRNPIDAFVLERLLAAGLAPAPEADRRQLARRLSLDARGLPPTSEEVEVFVRDARPSAYADLLKGWLASPAWGEHRARYWLDAARYADTHGLHFDNYREVWPYRDYVIWAFNRNLRFDRFTIEQIAGDLLSDPTDEQRVATGFHRCNMTTNEGGTIEEENLANYANDRVSTTGWVWLGLTLNCASCHDHKFDPLTTKEFYSMAAFFRNTKQSGFDKNIRESDLFMIVPQSEADRARWRALPDEITAARTELERETGVAESGFADWMTRGKPVSGVKLLGEEHLRLPLNDTSNISAFVDGKAQPLTIPAGMQFMTNGFLGAAPVFTADHNIEVGDAGNLTANHPFSLAAWVWLPEKYEGEGSILARMGGDPEQSRGWDFFVRGQEFGMHLIHRWSSVAMRVSSTGSPIRRREWQHLCLTYDGSGRTPGVRLFVNGIEVSADRNNNRLEGPIESPFPLRVGRRERSNALRGVAVQDARVYLRQLSPMEARVLAAAPRLSELLAQANAGDEPARQALRACFLFEQPDWRRAATHLAALEKEEQTIRGRSPVTLIQEEKSGSVPEARILARGQYDQPGEKVGAAVPSALHSWPEEAPRNRLGLSQWLVSTDNPLTARVTVNRFWAEVFGVGLVKTAEDFGATGDPPSNQALLDWLAVEFMESGWDVKHLFTLMLSSSTYRQSAETTVEKLAKDRDNRLLSRGPRFRMDAEMLRDYALGVSGLLVSKVGGPSVKPYQPGGVWEAVAMPESNTRHYSADAGGELYRRSLYTFWKRAAPPAMMDLFNAPSREVCTVRRERTNTPLQALATLNDPQFVEAARHLAEMALMSKIDPIDFMASRILLRPLKPAERDIIGQTLELMRDYYGQAPAAAEDLIATGQSPVSRGLLASEVAALTLVANQLLNLDEVLNK